MIRIVSRKSVLALAQAELVKQSLLSLYPKQSIEIIGISTEGDLRIDAPLNKIGGKGLFVKEIENYLLEDKADLAVHSMKDVPAMLPAGLKITAILSRANPYDALVSIDYNCIADLPKNAVIGTSSLRRACQIQALRDDLVIKNLRGNVDTRLDKLEAKEFVAIILACAGLIRLNLADKIKYIFTQQELLPAIGQGALGVEYKTDNLAIATMLKPLVDYITAACVVAERAMNQHLNGSCQAPIAGYAEVKGDTLYMTGLVAEPNGGKILIAKASGKFESRLPFDYYAAIGAKVAHSLQAQGAAKIIADLC